MKVNVIYTTQIKAALGRADEEVTFEGESVADLVRHLTTRHGDDFRRLAVDDSGRLLPSILICVDDDRVVSESAPLTDGTTVTFLSAISGG